MCSPRFGRDELGEFPWPCYVQEDNEEVRLLVAVLGIQGIFQPSPRLIKHFHLPYLLSCGLPAAHGRSHEPKSLHFARFIAEFVCAGCYYISSMCSGSLNSATPLNVGFL